MMTVRRRSAMAKTPETRTTVNRIDSMRGPDLRPSMNGEEMKRRTIAIRSSIALNRRSDRLLDSTCAVVVIGNDVSTRKSRLLDLINLAKPIAGQVWDEGLIIQLRLIFRKTFTNKARE